MDVKTIQATTWRKFDLNHRSYKFHDISHEAFNRDK